MANTERFIDIECAVNQAIKILFRQYRPEASGKLGWKEQVPVVMQRLGFVFEEIRSDLPEDILELTELDRQVVLLFLLKVVLDFDLLQDLGLMPPKGCPFEAWVCCAGPCKSGYSKRHHNLLSIKKYRRLTGIKDDIPEDYFDKFEEEWREIWNEEGVTREQGESDNNTPLILIPVRNLSETVKNAIVTNEPVLSSSIDNLFLCSDHFKKFVYKHGSLFAQKRFSSFTAENLNKSLESDEIKLVLAKIHFKNRKHLQKLLMLLSKGVQIDTGLRRREFDRKECAAQVLNRLKAMENTYGQRSDYNNYVYPSPYVQYEGRTESAQGSQHSGYSGVPTTE